MGATDHHAVQRGRVLRDVDHDGPHFEDGCVVGPQAALGTVQRLGLSDVTFHHRSEMIRGKYPKMDLHIISLISIQGTWRH